MRGRLDSFQFLTLAGYMNFFIVKPFKCGRCDELFKSGDGVESLMDYKRKQRQQLLHITPEEKIGTAVLILIWARRILTEILSSNWKKKPTEQQQKNPHSPPAPPLPNSSSHETPTSFEFISISLGREIFPLGPMGIYLLVSSITPCLTIVEYIQYSA